VVRRPEIAVADDLSKAGSLDALRCDPRFRQGSTAIYNPLPSRSTALLDGNQCTNPDRPAGCSLSADIQVGVTPQRIY
jgi:hypothetical protein